MFALLAALFLVASTPLATSQEPPVSVDGRFEIQLVAQEPEIANPTGLAVDRRGRIWAIENNTHMRTKDYPGPATDRLRVFEDFGPDGRARKVTTVADGFVLGMNVTIAPTGEVFLVTRNSIEIVKESRRPIVRLDTVGDYHHNGLFGLAVDPKGDLYFAMGRNTGKDYPLGAPWKLVGSDGSTVSGNDGGRIFRCRPDGSALQQVATGFWNTFHMTFDLFGRLFAVDNDPGGGSECRLLHIVPGGDYGFRPRAGYRDGHPFHSWTGEHPGTLPIVSFTGEAPSGILCDRDLWSGDEVGTLLVTSWGDHQVERYRLRPEGASFKAARDVLIRGGENFRPVGIAQGLDFSIVLSDWVDRSYPVHGKGRIWRLRRKQAGIPGVPPPVDIRLARVQGAWLGGGEGLDDATEEVRGEAVRLLPAADPRRIQFATKDRSPYVRLQALLGMKPPTPTPEWLISLLEDADPFLVGAAISVLGHPGASEELLRRASAESPKIRVGVLVALRRSGDKINPVVIRKFLVDPEPSIRRAAIQWAAEDGLRELSAEVAAAAARAPVTLDVFEAYLGALEYLTDPVSGRRDAKLAETHLVAILSDSAQPEAIRAYALRMLRPDHPLLALPKLQEWLEAGNEALRMEATRTMALSTLEPAQEALRKLAADARAPLRVRMEATAGLGHSAATSPATRQVLLSLLDGDSEEIRVEAVRSVGGAAADPEVRRALHRLLKTQGERRDFLEKVALVLKLGGDSVDAPQPTTNTEWAAAADGSGDPAEGERLFFHPRGPQCHACHKIRGRGGEVGPDLSRVSRGMDRDRLITSILDPSREIGPDFAAWEILTREGDSWVGRILKEDTKTLSLLGPSGRPVVLPREEIVGRRPSRVSMMPDGLQKGLTRKEFRDPRRLPRLAPLGAVEESSWLILPLFPFSRCLSP
jgi:putative membrane-bound dehydrogenase-like protein